MAKNTKHRFDPFPKLYFEHQIGDAKMKTQNDFQISIQQQNLGEFVEQFETGLP